MHDIECYEAQLGMCGRRCRPGSLHFVYGSLPGLWFPLSRPLIALHCHTCPARPVCLSSRSTLLFWRTARHCAMIYFEYVSSARHCHCDHNCVLWFCNGVGQHLTQYGSFRNVLCLISCKSHNKLFVFTVVLTRCIVQCFVFFHRWIVSAIIATTSLLILLRQPCHQKKGIVRQALQLSRIHRIISMFEKGNFPHRFARVADENKIFNGSSHDTLERRNKSKICNFNCLNV